MAINLSRNTKFYVSTVKNTNKTASTNPQLGHSTTNTFEIPVLDGYSFSQDADTQTITLNEAGNSPVRGQKIFNTALNPADVTFSTYVRPYYNSGHNCVEAILWEALVGRGNTPNEKTYGLDKYNSDPLYNARADGTNRFTIDFENSDDHDLLQLYLFFNVDTTVYRVNRFTISSVEIDFSIDGIAQLNWSGQGTSIEELSTTAGTSLAEFNLWEANTNYVAAKGIGASSTDALFIKNKLSSISLKKSERGLTPTITEGIWTVDFGNAIDVTALHTLTAATTRTFDVTVDGGTLQTVSIIVDSFAGTTIQDVIDEMNYQLEDCLVRVVDGDLVFESFTSGNVSGSESTVLVAAGTTDLLSDLAGYVGIGSATAGAGTPTNYVIPITGGSLTIENNTTYLVPEELGVVNVPIGSFTGTRAISGNLTAYLNTGANSSGGLLADLLEDNTTITNDFEMTIFMGGESNTPRVGFKMPNAHLVIPSINVEDVISTEINFTALGSTVNEADELYIEYIAQ